MMCNGVEEKKTRETRVETPRITAMGTPNIRRRAKVMQMVSITYITSGLRVSCNAARENSTARIMNLTPIKPEKTGMGR
jgi:hypothetical protein